MIMHRQKGGFTYIEIMISMALIFLFMGFFMQLNQYNYKLRNRSDEINKMTMAGQGVMDAYRTLGKAGALSYTEGYTIDITENSEIEHAKLNKITVTVTPKISGVNTITLVSYQTQ